MDVNAALRLTPAPTGIGEFISLNLMYHILYRIHGISMNHQEFLADKFGVFLWSGNWSF